MSESKKRRRQEVEADTSATTTVQASSTEDKPYQEAKPKKDKSSKKDKSAKKEKSSKKDKAPKEDRPAKKIKHEKEAAALALDNPSNGETPSKKEKLSNGETPSKKAKSSTEEKPAKKEKSSKKDKSSKRKRADDEEADIPNPSQSQAAEPASEPSTDKRDKKKRKKNKGAKTDAAAADSTAAATVATAEDEPADDADADAEGGKSSRFICFIGNLPYTATAGAVRAHFSSLSPIDVRVLTERDDPKKSRGVAFIEFGRYDHMRTCLDKYHHSEFCDNVSPARKINVELT